MHAHACIWFESMIYRSLHKDFDPQVALPGKEETPGHRLRPVAMPSPTWALTLRRPAAWDAGTHCRGDYWLGGSGCIQTCQLRYGQSRWHKSHVSSHFPGVASDLQYFDSGGCINSLLGGQWVVWCSVTILWRASTLVPWLIHDFVAGAIRELSKSCS